jgi:serralysin
MESNMAVRVATVAVTKAPSLASSVGLCMCPRCVAMRAALDASANGTATVGQIAIITTVNNAIQTLHSDTLSQQQSSTIAFESGLTASGQPAALSYWNMTGGSVSAVKWGAPIAGISGGTVTYYIDPSWDASQQISIKAAFALWSAEGNINLVQTNSSTNADIDIANQPNTGSATTGVNYTGGSNGIASLSAGVITNIDANTFGSPDSYASMAGYGIGTVVHEIGHEIGLGHSGPYNGAVDSSTEQYGAYDSRAYSIMSYINPSDSTAAFYSQYAVNTQWILYTPSTPMQDDILAEQQLYGVNENGALSGNNIFGFNCNIGEGLNYFFDFSINTKPVCTLYDTGTNNTLDTSDFTGSNQTINLNAGTFSSVGGLTNNIYIADGTIINNAIGDNGQTTFILNNNSDAIQGEGSNNIAVMPGTRASYNLSVEGGNIVATGNGDIDTLKDITQINFSNGVTVNTISLLEPTLFGGGSSPAPSSTSSSSALAYVGENNGIVPVINVNAKEAAVAVGAAGNTLTLTTTGSSVAFTLANTPTILSFSDNSGVADPSGNTGDIARLYQAIFDRTSDVNGLAYWTGQIDSGTLGIMDVANAFIASNEGAIDLPQSTRSFVSSIYQNALGRAPDASGLDYWTNSLNTGATTKATLIVNIAESSEAQITTMKTDGSTTGSDIYRIYETIMGHAPDTNGLIYWTGELLSGISEATIATNMTSSSEFTSDNLSSTAYINQIYTQGLGRSADASGLAYWEQQLTGGATRAQVALSFANSHEANTLYASATHSNWTLT